jgi:serine/tyrosine/threonine adenylyltransferase
MSSPKVSAIAPSAVSGSDRQPVRFVFENMYARLPERFYGRLNPTSVAASDLIKLNVELARNLRLDPDALASPEGVEILAGDRVAGGAEPLAIVYAGHQFGQFVPELGDGRNVIHLVFRLLAL